MFKAFWAALAFALTFYIGIFVSIKSWQGMVYWYPDANERVPAAIKKVFDFSHLEGAALALASYKRLLADATVISDDQRVGIEFGHFVFKTDDDRKLFACQYYNKMELVFHSADLSVSGEPSEMIIEAPCSVSNNINRIDTVWVPMKKITQANLRDSEMQTRDERVTNFSFKNIGDRWPRAWALHSIKMLNDNDINRIMSINHMQMREIIDRPITLVWAEEL